MKIEKRCLSNFLLSCTTQQYHYFLKTLNRDQLQIIIEIIYNVVQGVCTIVDKDKTTLKKRQRLIREILLPRLTPLQRKRKLFKIKQLLPIFLKACYRHGS